MNRTILAVLATLLSTTTCFGETITLNHVLESVNRAYPLVISAQKDLEKAQGDFHSAQGGFDPVLRANSIQIPNGYYQYNFLDTTIEQALPVWGTKVYGGWRTGQGNFPLYDGRYATYTGGELRGGLEIPILKNGAIDERRARIQTSEKGSEIAEASLQVQRLETIRQGSQRYWDWVAAGRKLKISQELLENADVRDKALLHRVKHGDAPLFEQVENQRAVIQRQYALMNAERNLQKTTLELSLYLRDREGNPLLADKSQLPTAFPEPEEIRNPDLQNQFQAVVLRHPELKRLEYLAEQTNIDLKFSKNQILPRLDLQLGASLDMGTPPSPTVSSAYFLPAYPSELKVAITLEIPLFFRTAKGKAEAAQAAVGRLEAQTVLMRDRIKTNLTDALQAMQVSQKRISLARKELELARKLENGERVRFQHGDGTLLIVNIREQVTGDAAIRETDAFLEYYRAKADYQMALAQQ